MSLTPENIRDIRETWSLLAQDADGMTAQFYDELFSFAPEVRPLFAGSDMTAQSRKLAAAVGLVVRHADNLAPVLLPLQEMGARHADYGVETSHYTAVGNALISTMHHRLGDAFTPTVRDAWVAAYTAVAQAMQSGAAGAMKRTA